ncbi:RNA helicase required for poly(A+) mRNA export [Tilletia horrida]|nr:RNA helicase required for poly(A+) mRNA export [Tilletia horrida]
MADSKDITESLSAVSDRIANLMGKGSDDAGKDTPAEKKADGAEAAGEEKVEGRKPTELRESSYDVTVTLADQQADPNSPLFSAKSFEQLGLHEDLLKGIYAMKYQKPSKIQERALPLLLQNPPRNMIGQSQSGTGKTAAFVLTMLSRIDYSIKMPQAIALAPSRELARQTMDVVHEMGKFTPVTTAYAIPDAVKRGDTVTAQLIVGTPGKLTELIKYKTLDTSHVKVFVLDEADNMLDQQGLGEQSIRVKNMLPKTCQLVLFSATFPDHVRDFAARIAPSANEIRLRQEELSVEAIKQFYMDCKNEEHKYEVLVELYNLLTIGQSIIFCAKRETADQIAKRMTAEGHKVDSLHGKLDSAARDRTIDEFRDGKIKVLIATNVIARGIDIQQVTLVINYDMPLTQGGSPDAETYLHRIGRTGRFGRKGVSINFVHDKTSWEHMNQIETLLKCNITRVSTDDLESMEKTIKDASCVTSITGGAHKKERSSAISNGMDKGKGKGKAEGVSTSDQSGGTSSAAPAQPASTSNGNGSGTAGPSPFNGVRAGGIASELAGLLRSSGKPEAAGSSVGAGAGVLLGASGSALSDALGGPVEAAGGAGPGATFRRAGGETSSSHSTGAQVAAAALRQDEATAFFQQGGAAGPSAQASAAPIAAPAPLGGTFQHPFLKPGAPLSPRLAQFSEALRGPWSTASDLDGELHAHARRESLALAMAEQQAAAMQASQQSAGAWSDEFSASLRADEARSAQANGVGVALEEAWRAHAGGTSGSLEDFGAEWLAQLDEPMRRAMLDPNYHAEWARTVPAPAFGPDHQEERHQAPLPIQQSGDEMDFFATLQAEEREEEARARRDTSLPAPASAVPSQAADLAQLGIDAARLPSGITTEWRPPSPSHPSNVSVEQLLLHRALAAKQEATEEEDEDRARERIRPADDDERERQGLFAPTPEDALRSVWDGQAEAERVKRDKEARLTEIAQKQRTGEAVATSTADVEQLIADVKRWFPRGSYVDEVHGLPPVLAQTLADAELPADETDPDLAERRLAAIRRLDAMRSHLLSAGRPRTTAPGLTPDALAAMMERGRLSS